MSKVQLLSKIQRVLIIDDNEVTRNSLKRHFEDHKAIAYTSGHIEKATSILKGLLAQNKLPDMIVLDVRLPGCYGLQPLQMLCDVLNGRKVPTVVCSRGFNHLAVRRMSFLGVIGYVEKPVLIKDLFKFTFTQFLEVRRRRSIEYDNKKVRKSA